LGVEGLFGLDNFFLKSGRKMGEAGAVMEEAGLLGGGGVFEEGGGALEVLDEEKILFFLKMGADEGVEEKKKEEGEDEAEMEDDHCLLCLLNHIWAPFLFFILYVKNSLFRQKKKLNEKGFAEK
jgi:hypothetical protein